MLELSEIMDGMKGFQIGPICVPTAPRPLGEKYFLIKYT
jgi:hypothetical protein